MVRFGTVFFFLFLSYGVLTPYLQLFFKLQGYSAFEIGLLLGTFELAGVAGPLLIGRLADRLQKYRTLLIVSCTGSILFFTLLLVTGNLPVSLLLITGVGFWYRVSIPLTDALAMRTLKDPTHDYGRARVLGSLGFILMSFLIQSGAVMDIGSVFSIAAVFIATELLFTAAIPVLPGSAVLMTKPAESGDPSGRIFSPFFIVGIIVIFLGRFGLSAHYSFFSLYLQNELGLSNVSLLWAIGPVSEIPFILFSGKIIRKFGLRSMFVASLLGVSLRLIVYAAFPSLLPVILSQFLHAFTFGTFHTASVAFIDRSVRPEKKALGMSIYAAVGTGISSFTGSIVGGAVLDAYGFRALFGVFAVVPAIGIVLLLAAFRKYSDLDHAPIRT